MYRIVQNLDNFNDGFSKAVFFIILIHTYDSTDL